MGKFLVGFDKNTGFQNYWCEKGNETKDESYGFFKGAKSLGVGLYVPPDSFNPGDTCIINLETEEIHIATQQEINLIEEKEKKESLITKHISLANKICEDNILKKYSRDDQRNIDRDALHLKALEAIDSARLKAEEVEWLKTHKEMSNYINNELKVARELKAKIKTMSYEQLKEFNIEGSYVS